MKDIRDVGKVLVAVVLIGATIVCWKALEGTLAEVAHRFLSAISGV